MKNNNYSEDGIVKGAVGYIVDIYDENYCEVEFSDKDGITYALQAICVKDFVALD